MAELVCRTLRDGVLNGEHAPALTIKDAVDAYLGCSVFDHFLTQLSSSIAAGNSQAKAIIIVCYSRSASFYLKLLQQRGCHISSSHKCIYILDCFTDPLGWKKHLNLHQANDSETIRVVTEVNDLDQLRSSVVESGVGLVGKRKERFAVAIDSISAMLRHTSLQKVAEFVSNLRSHSNVSSIFWVLHSDLHEKNVSSSLEYISSMVESVEHTIITIPLDNVTSSETQLHTRIKRRNGRVRVVREEFSVTQNGIEFASVSSKSGNNDHSLPKVHFNLQLTEKERIERANVVLPFEHQGNGKPIEIYDGRKVSCEEESKGVNCNEGEIVYFRDSDDEMPDSDEDPDDDLDI